jgi:hypothetical protein
VPDLCEASATGVGADFSGGPYEPDVWGYLTATQGLTPGTWAKRPVTCSSNGGGSYSCGAETADGYVLQAQVIGSGAGPYLVSGIYAGGG